MLNSQRKCANFEEMLPSIFSLLQIFFVLALVAAGIEQRSFFIPCVKETNITLAEFYRFQASGLLTQCLPSSLFNVPENCMAFGSHCHPLVLSMYPALHPHVYPFRVLEQV